jgi:hypothetical protein
MSGLRLFWLVITMSPYHHAPFKIVVKAVPKTSWIILYHFKFFALCQYQTKSTTQPLIISEGHLHSEMHQKRCKDIHARHNEVFTMMRYSIQWSTTLAASNTTNICSIFMNILSKCYSLDMAVKPVIINMARGKETRQTAFGATKSENTYYHSNPET